MKRESSKNSLTNDSLVGIGGMAGSSEAQKRLETKKLSFRGWTYPGPVLSMPTRLARGKLELLQDVAGTCERKRMLAKLQHSPGLFEELDSEGLRNFFQPKDRS